jgi:hypothetical protein
MWVGCILIHVLLLLLLLLGQLLVMRLLLLLQAPVIKSSTLSTLSSIAI